MSFSGFQIHGEAFTDGEQVRLAIPQRGDTHAQIRWASGSTAGARFAEDRALGDIVPARDRQALRRCRSFNFGSGRAFGRRGSSLS
ncbi:MAG: hypothetical protein H0V46_04855 [Sphingomonas sp.]|nr:hypothetical protein [Sphingomonas sp.]